MATSATITSPFRFEEPLPQVSAIVQGQKVTIQFPPGKRIASCTLSLQSTKAALGSGNFSIPVPSDSIGEMRLNIAGNTNRRRQAAHLFGYFGLNALNQDGAGGTVIYQQGANFFPNNGIANTVAGEPVRIGSPEDLAQQALLTANTATTAFFQLPIVFAEDFRKEYTYAELMALITGFSDGTGIGTVILEMDIPNTANTSAVGITAAYEYDDTTAAPGSIVFLSKEKIFTKQYSAAGDFECGDALQVGLKAGQILQRVSLLTVADQISKVVVKQGNRILRNVTKAQNDAALAKAGFNIRALIPNRFDIEFDVNDDPNSAVVIDPNNQLSIVATLATAADAGKTITLLPSIYGPVE